MPAPGQPNNPTGVTGGPGSPPPNQVRGVGQSAAQPVRTPTGGSYGEGQALTQAQQAVPLARTPGEVPRQPMAAGNPAAGNVVPIGAPTQRPTEPVTAGATMGAGPGPISPVAQANYEDLGKLNQYLPVLEAMANMPGSMPTTRLIVNYLRANTGAKPPQPQMSPEPQGLNVPTQG